MRALVSSRLRSIVLPTLLLSLACGTAAAEWYVTRITNTAEDSRHPHATYDVGGGLHLLWEESGEIKHRLYTESGVGEVETVGIGDRYDRWTCLS